MSNNITNIDPIIESVIDLGINREEIYLEAVRQDRCPGVMAFFLYLRSLFPFVEFPSRQTDFITSNSWYIRELYSNGNFVIDLHNDHVENMRAWLNIKDLKSKTQSDVNAMITAKAMKISVDKAAVLIDLAESGHFQLDDTWGMKGDGFTQYAFKDWICPGEVVTCIHPCRGHNYFILQTIAAQPGHEMKRGDRRKIPVCYSPDEWDDAEDALAEINLMWEEIV